MMLNVFHWILLGLTSLMGLASIHKIRQEMKEKLIWTADVSHERRSIRIGWVVSILYLLLIILSAYNPKF